MSRVDYKYKYGSFGAADMDNIESLGLALVDRVQPVIGKWYKRPGRSIFEVVAIDDDERTIGLQHFDGTVDELDIESWDAAFIEIVEAPEDYSGSLDMQARDYEAKQDGQTAQTWDDPLNYLDQVE